MVTWQPTADDIQRVLAEQNPWARRDQVPEVLAPPVERPLAQHLWRRLLDDRPRRFHLVLGPRRVGKTTAMYQTVRHLIDEGVPAERLWWFRLDHPVLLSSTLEVLVRAATRTSGATEHEPVFLFLDELVYAEDWDLWLKTFYDDHWPVRIVATSSATAARRGRRLESGVGRWEEHYLSPYTFAEYLDLVGGAPEIEIADTLAATLTRLSLTTRAVAALEAPRRRLIIAGGFPELLIDAQSNDEEGRLLHSQQVLRSDAVERAVYKDIPQSFGVDNPMALERLLYVLAGQIASILSPRNICSDLGLSQPTFDRYLSYLERAFIVFTRPNYSGAEGSVQRRGRKLYFVDGAVRNAALQRGLSPLTNPSEMGVLLENLVAANMHALAEHAGWRLFHWRDGAREVDLLVDQPEPLAIEVGMSADHSRAGLMALAERHPQFRGRCWLVAPDARFVTPDESPANVGAVPVDAFLLAVGTHAAAAARARLGA